MLEIKQLNQLVEDLSNVPASVQEPAEPKVDTAKAVKDALDILIYKHF
jgi:hypothetical protein